MERVLESEQICINCKGAGKKISVPMVMVIPVIGPPCVFGGYMLYHFGHPILGIMGPLILLVMLSDLKKQCPTCKGKGKTTTTTRYTE